jgi:hypothetical protein
MLFRAVAREFNVFATREGVVLMLWVALTPDGRNAEQGVITARLAIQIDERKRRFMFLRLYYLIL